MAIEQSARTANVEAPLQVTTAGILDQDWEASVRASYKPLQLTGKLWIVPDWFAAPCVCQHCVCHSSLRIAGHAITVQHADAQ